MKYLLMLSLFAVPLFLHAQWTNESWLWGIQLGGNYSPNNISDLPETIIPPLFPLNTYETVEHKPYGFTGNLFLYRRPDNFPWVAFQGDLGVSQQYGGYDYEDINDLKYTMKFKYWYGSLLLSGKIYPLAKKNRNDEQWYTGIYLRGGLQAAANLNREGISYCHSPEEIYGPCEYVKGELQAVLKGTGYMGWTVGLGLLEFEFGASGFGLGLEARYYQSLGDIMDTLPNNYGFSDQSNRIETFQATVNFAIPLN